MDAAATARVRAAAGCPPDRHIASSAEHSCVKGAPPSVASGVAHTAGCSESALIY